MPFSVSGELCMDRKAVRHALIMALETFTIDDKWSKSLLQSRRLFFIDAAARPALSRRTTSSTTETRLRCGLCAVGAAEPARGKQKHRRTNERTDINDSCTE